MKPRSNDLYRPKEKSTDGRDSIAGGHSSSHRSHRYKSDGSRRCTPSMNDRTVDDYRRGGRHEYRTEVSYGRRVHRYREGDYYHSGSSGGCRMQRSESCFDLVKGFRSERDRCYWRRRCGEDLKRKRYVDDGRGRYYRDDFRRNRDVRYAVKAPGGELPVLSEVKVEEGEQLRRDGGGSCSEMEEGELEPEKESLICRDFNEGELKLGCTPGFGGGDFQAEDMGDGNKDCNDVNVLELVPDGGLIRGESSFVYEVEPSSEFDSAAIEEGNDLGNEEDGFQEEIEGIPSDDVDIGGDSHDGVDGECYAGVEDPHGGDGDDFGGDERDDCEKSGANFTFCDIDHTKVEKFDASEKENPLGMNTEKGFRLFGCHLVKETDGVEQLDSLEIELVNPLELCLSRPSLSFHEPIHDSTPDKDNLNGFTLQFPCLNFQNFVRNKEQDYQEISHIETYSEYEREVGRGEEVMTEKNEHFQDESSVSHDYGNVNKIQQQIAEVVSLGNTSTLDFCSMIHDIKPREHESCLVPVSSCCFDEPGCSSWPVFVDTIIRYILSEPICVVSKMFQGMSDISLSSLKEGVCQTLFGDGNATKLSKFQKILDKRDEITIEMLLKCHRNQLEIMVALKTGMSYFVLQNSSVSSYELGEIFLQMRCKNLNCRCSLPVDGHDCRICSKKNGFCSSCMCLICSEFDAAYNTCSWVGCDVCLHWCHTDCALRESLIRNEINMMESIHFHCIVCGHPSDMYGFVKEVFESFAKTWSKDTLFEELGCVGRIFRESVDGKGRQIYDTVSGVLKKLVSFSTLADAYGPLLQLFSGEGSPSVEGRGSTSIGKDKGVRGEDGLRVELGEMVRMKRAEAEVFQVQADSAKREGDGLRRMAEAEMHKIEEEFICRLRKVDLVHVQESRRQKLQHLQTLEAARHLYFNMKARMESDINHLLFQMEATSHSITP